MFAVMPKREKMNKYSKLKIIIKNQSITELITPFFLRMKMKWIWKRARFKMKMKINLTLNEKASPC